MSKEVSMAEILDMDDMIVSATGYTRGDLGKAFDKLTEGMENWKMPIKSTIMISEWSMMNEACAWFTGSTLNKVKVIDPGMIEVEADGYYLTIGA